MKFNITDENAGSLTKIQENIESNAGALDSIVDEIISPYCRDLDSYVKFIKDCLKDGENPPTNEELDDFCMNLSTYIYFASGMTEHLGIRDDIAKAVAVADAYYGDRDNVMYRVMKLGKPVMIQNVEI